jgi:hypothetical protein
VCVCVSVSVRVCVCGDPRTIRLLYVDQSAGWLV